MCWVLWGGGGGGGGGGDSCVRCQGVTMCSASVHVKCEGWD